VTYRNRRLLNLAHECPCTAQFSHYCTQYQGVEPAHSDQQIFGRGHGHKSHDFAFAAMCHTAHLMLDSMSIAKEHEHNAALAGSTQEDSR
jgi:hypothetical protein